MGYEVEDTTYTLEFDDRPGAEVRMRAGSVEDHLAALRMDWVLAPGELQRRHPNDDEAQEAEVRKLYAIFVRHVESWNLERKGQLVPVTVEGVMGLDREFVKPMVTAWLRGVFGLSAPLETHSGDTETTLPEPDFDESTIPMEDPQIPIPLAG